jgi:hypothetical protein
VLDSCLQDGTWPARTLDALIERALDDDNEFLARSATRALFGLVIERLGDLFEPSLCDVYARLFSHVISRALPEYNTEGLLLRYGRVRQVRRFPGGEIRRVFVLSRVTLGADVAVTSVALDAAKQRFPEAEILLIGPAKNVEMFAADPHVTAVTVMYARSSLLRERLAAAAELQVAVDEQGAIVIDPDSRLTQLGLIPICDDSRYFFFESRAFGGEFATSLPQLTAEWLAEVFDVEGVGPYVAPSRQEKIAEITVSFGVGENAKKRIDDQFEYDVLAALLRQSRPILLIVVQKVKRRRESIRLYSAWAHPLYCLCIRAAMLRSQVISPKASFISVTIRRASTWLRRGTSHWFPFSKAMPATGCSRVGGRQEEDLTSWP